MAKVANTVKRNYRMLIIDESGSMASVTDVTREGINEQIQTVKKNAKKFKDQEFFTTVIFFNDDVRFAIFNESTDSLEELKKDDYVPNGSTAMWDAIGEGVRRLKEDIVLELKDPNTTVEVTIFTDGYENASSQENKKIVPDLVKELQESKNSQWVFSIVGSKHTNVLDIAKELNIDSVNSITYDTSLVGTQAAFRGMANASFRYAKRKSAGLHTNKNYFENDDGLKDDFEKIEEEK